MISVETLNLSDVRMKFWRDYFDAGYGPRIVEGNAGAPPPPVGGNNLIWDPGNPLIWGAGNNLIWGTS